MEGTHKTLFKTKDWGEKGNVVEPMWVMGKLKPSLICIFSVIGYVEWGDRFGDQMWHDEMCRSPRAIHSQLGWHKEWQNELGEGWRDCWVEGHETKAHIWTLDNALRNGPIGYTIDTCQDKGEIVVLENRVVGMEMRTCDFCYLLVGGMGGLLFVFGMGYGMVFVQGWQTQACLAGWHSFVLHT